jgi:RNA polymerase sigma-70 factor (ECF subfamily)
VARFTDDDPGSGWDWDAATAICLREARRQLGTGPDAEEAAQEAVLRAWRKRSQCVDPRQPEPWLRQIAQREASRIRDRAAKQPQPSADPPERPAAGDPLADAADRLDIDVLLRGFSKLDRALVTLRYVGDLTQPEVAAALEMPEGTVKVRLHRLRTRLRAALLPEEES